MSLTVVKRVDVVGEKLFDGGRCGLTRGSGPFCSWTRLAGLALLIWGDRAKSGERPGRRRDLAKNTPRYGRKNDKVTRWPKRHNTSQNGRLWVSEVNQPPKMPGPQTGVFSASGLVNAVGSWKSAFLRGNSNRLRLLAALAKSFIH